MTAETTYPYTKPGPSEMLIDDFSRADWPGMLKALSQTFSLPSKKQQTSTLPGMSGMISCVRTIRLLFLL